MEQRANAVSKKVGVMLVNLGSPSAPTTSAVRRYLKEFLWDYRVVNLPRPLWWLILNFIVLPLRPKKSAEAYQKIWQKQGSPLVFLSQQLTQKVAAQFDSDIYSVDCVMRYGSPSIAKCLDYYKANQIDELVVIPLYPQYSSTTTASVYDAVMNRVMRWWYIPSIRFVSDYYQQPLYIAALADSIQTHWQQHGKNERLLMSFHGLPAQLTKWGDPYFQQCHCTADLVAKKLGLDEGQWQIVFQSRFGKAEWLQPYCVEVLQQLPEQGIKSIDVICAGFAVDCLETLEEIEITNKAVFIEAGGESYHYIPALNSVDAHVDLIVDLIKG